MDFNEYQDGTHATAVYPEGVQRVCNLGIERTMLEMAYCVAGLTSEAGEVAGKFKKIVRGDKDIASTAALNEIAHELGGVLYYVAQLADLCDWTLEEVAKYNNTQLTDRMERGVIRGDGDYR